MLAELAARHARAKHWAIWAILTLALTLGLVLVGAGLGLYELPSQLGFLADAAGKCKYIWKGCAALWGLKWR